MNKIGSFLGEVRSELKKLSWPSRDELVGSTVIVCLLAVVFACILGMMDFGFNYVIRIFIF